MENQEKIEPRKEGKKRVLQKISQVISVICLIVGTGCGIYLFTLDGESQEVLKASFGAITFFCFTVGLVLKAIADTNLPDLSVKSED